MTTSDTFEKDLLSLILCATPIANIADNAASGPLTALWWSLHTADPGDTATQGTSETSYAGYTRIATSRTTAGFTVSTADGTASPTTAVTFPQATSTSTGTLTHAGLGVSSASTGGKLLWSGAISPNINFGSGVQPSLTTATAVTQG